MIELIENMPAGTVGFRAVGTVEPDDYKNVLDPAVDELLQQHDKINMVYVIGDDYDRYSVGAIWQDAKFGARNPHVWGRVAMVTDHDWLRHAMAIFGPITPGDCKVFPLSEQAAAIDWVGGG